MYVRYRRKGEQGTTAFKLMMKSLFKYKDKGSAPNLISKVKIVADRGYWGRDMLRYLLSKGADLLGTVKRLLWFKYTWGKKGSATSAKSSEKLESIPLDGQPRWYQSTAKHNFGRIHSTTTLLIFPFLVPCMPRSI